MWHDSIITGVSEALLIVISTMLIATAFVIEQGVGKIEEELRTMASEYNEKVQKNLLCSYSYMYYRVAAGYQSIVYCLSCHRVPASVSRLLQLLSCTIG
jgi:fructose-specific phosphotransferase system IIC component